MEFNATFLISAISFVIFTLIMNKILYQPITDIVNKRKAYFDANEKDAKTNLDGADSIRHDNAQKILLAKNQEKENVAAAVAKGQEDKIRLEKEKKEELLEKYEEKQRKLEEEKNSAEILLAQNVAELAELIVSKLTGGKI